MPQAQTNIVFIVATLTVIFLLMAVFMVLYVILYNSRKRKHLEEKDIMEQTFALELVRTQVEVQENTFAALGKDLHDNIGQLLSTTKMLIGVTERTIPDPPDALFIANQTLGKAIHELRLLSKTLNKDWLEQFSLIENLDAEVERINATETIQVKLAHPEQISMQVNEQLILFRIIQEAIQNAIKHAKGSKINITITSNNEALTVSIVDDGECFDIEKTVNGLGIINMRHRIKLLGGEINWSSDPDTGGCIVDIIIPLKETHEN